METVIYRFKGETTTGRHDYRRWLNKRLGIYDQYLVNETEERATWKPMIPQPWAENQPIDPYSLAFEEADDRPELEAVYIMETS
jgi:hypothetical protein